MVAIVPLPVSGIYFLSVRTNKTLLPANLGPFNITHGRGRWVIGRVWRLGWVGETAIPVPDLLGSEGDSRGVVSRVGWAVRVGMALVRVVGGLLGV